MSTINFRAWHPVHKMMMQCGNTEEFFMISSDDGSVVRFVDNTIQKVEGWVVMQSTGLKDGKRNEIYESDIVQFHANYTNKPAGHLNGVVVWDYDSWKLKAGGHLYSISEETDEFYYKALVCGNIHESPSLLPL